MPKYYISPATGDDSTGDGTANNPWATIGHAIDGGGSPAIAPWPAAEEVELVLEPGVYAGVIRCRVAPTEASPLKIVGDFDGSLFAAGGKANPKTGAVVLRAAGETEFPSPRAPLLDLGGQSWITLSRLVLRGGSQSSSSRAQALEIVGSSHVEVRDCEIDGPANNGQHPVLINLAPGSTSDVVLRRCVVIGSSAANASGVRVNCEAADDDYDAEILFEACLFLAGQAGVRLVRTGSGAGFPMGVRVQSCTFHGQSGQGVSAFEGLAVVPSAPVVVARDSVMGWAGVAFRCGAVGQVDENGNVLLADTPRVNAAIGADTVVPRHLSLNWPIAVAGGDRRRPPFEPLADSMLVGWGAYGTTPALDLLGRPYADPPACGCLERVDPEPDPEPGGTTYIFQTEG